MMFNSFEVDSIMANCSRLVTARLKDEEMKKFSSKILSLDRVVVEN